MHQNTPNLNSNIYFNTLGLPWGSKSRFDQYRGFFAPNQKVQKPKYGFIGPINNSGMVRSVNFEITLLSEPPTVMGYVGDATLVRARYKTKQLIGFKET